MDPSLIEFELFTAQDVRKWMEERYSELQTYGPAIETKNVTGRVLLDASAGAIKEDLNMTASHAEFLKCRVSKIMEGERWASAKVVAWYFAVLMMMSDQKHFAECVHQMKRWLKHQVPALKR